MPDHYNDAMKEMRTRLPTSDAEQNAMMGLATEGLKMAAGGGATSDAEMAAMREATVDLETMKTLVAMGLTPEEAMREISKMKSTPVDPSAFSGAATASMTGQGVLGGMTDKDMAMYLQNKVSQLRSDRGMGALAGVPAGNQMPMPMPTPRPENLMMRNQSMGQDRTMNPMNTLTPRNVPST
jgi:hypothetical protein